MNDKELEELNRNVQLAGICREKYIRCALMGITIHPRAPDSCKALARQVAAVGNNLNQFNGKAEDAYLQEAQQIMTRIWLLMKEQL